MHEESIHRIKKALKMADFTTELKALLIKYNASIDFDCSDCSDLHGVYGEKVVASFREGNTYKYTEVELSKGWSVSSEDLI